MYFEKEYEFKGKHAFYAEALANIMFKRVVDVLIAAPVIGLVYNRTSKIDKESEYANKYTKSIFGEQITGAKDKILFNYRLCMLLDEYSTKEERIDNAFKYYTDECEDEESLKRFKRNIELYNSYVLGGVEILYERMLNENKSFNGDLENEAYKNEIFNLVTEFINSYDEDAKDFNEIDDTIDEF